MEEKKRCAKRIYDGTYKGHLCRKPFFSSEAGEDWCTVHAPSTIKAKIEKRDALWARERRQRDAGYVVGNATRNVVEVAKGWFSAPDDEMNIGALKTAVKDLLDAENKERATS